MNNQFTILINTTDRFEDCWYPFFKLFNKFWPDCDYKIVLNTETKSYSYPGLDISCAKVYGNHPEQKLTWSECLIKCLETIDTDLILYIQEDYFLNAPVDVKQIQEFARIMAQENWSYISLVSFSNNGPWHPTTNPLLWEVDQKDPYRISMQAALWRKERLRFYLRKHENPWQFEVWGSKRAHHIKDSFYCVSHEAFNENTCQILPYEPTGVIKGKWNEKAVSSLFRENEIDVDFSKRGFFDPNKINARKAPIFLRAVARLRSLV